MPSRSSPRAAFPACANAPSSLRGRLVVVGPVPRRRSSATAWRNQYTHSKGYPRASSFTPHGRRRRGRRQRLPTALRASVCPAIRLEVSLRRTHVAFACRRRQSSRARRPAHRVVAPTWSEAGGVNDAAPAVTQSNQHLGDRCMPPSVSLRPAAAPGRIWIARAGDFGRQLHREAAASSSPRAAQPCRPHGRYNRYGARGDMAFAHPRRARATSDASTSANRHGARDGRSVSCSISRQLVDDVPAPPRELSEARPSAATPARRLASTWVRALPTDTGDAAERRPMRDGEKTCSSSLKEEAERPARGQTPRSGT
jgi:hypothetical protein